MIPKELVTQSKLTLHRVGTLAGETARQGATQLMSMVTEKSLDIDVVRSSLETLARGTINELGNVATVASGERHTCCDSSKHRSSMITTRGICPAPENAEKRLFDATPYPLPPCTGKGAPVSRRIALRKGKATLRHFWGCFK